MAAFICFVSLHGSMMNTLLDLHWYRDGEIMGQPFCCDVETVN
jgi:hypothetical protein